MRGQLITSTLSGLTAIAVLWPLHVPAAVGLAVLSFVGDFVPVVGFIASLIPAVLLAMLRGPKAALIVAAVYFGYQIVENYIISPKVYGKAMRISTLTVLLTIIVGGILLGPIGAIILLPVAAAYPAIERIWLQKHLPAETIERHDAIESDDDAESEQATKDALRT
jgi:predicted PurR-regulated permease PerM